MCTRFRNELTRPFRRYIANHECISRTLQIPHDTDRFCFTRKKRSRLSRVEAKTKNKKRSRSSNGRWCIQARNRATRADDDFGIISLSKRCSKTYPFLTTVIAVGPNTNIIESWFFCSRKSNRALSRWRRHD